MLKLTHKDGLWERIISLPFCEDKRFEPTYRQLRTEISGINDVVKRSSLMSSLNDIYNISRAERKRTYVYSWNEVR